MVDLVHKGLLSSSSSSSSNGFLCSSEKFMEVMSDVKSLPRTVESSCEGSQCISVKARWNNSTLLLEFQFS